LLNIPAPFDRYRGEVATEWIDLNGHMNLAYYTVLFDYATDLLFETIGIGKEYKRATNHGTFVVETHNLYEQELLVGEQVRVVTQIIAADDKRLHLAHEMARLADERRAAMQELMFLSIDLGLRRVAPFLPGVRAKVMAAAGAHAALPRPDWVGRRLGMPISHG
jgi:acyl-CoA thioester hydrolase